MLLSISTSNFLWDVCHDSIYCCVFSSILLIGFACYHSLSRYFYNKRTKFSSWEKPAEMMTPLEVSCDVYFFS
jgi:hypothetical protein